VVAVIVVVNSRGCRNNRSSRSSSSRSRGPNHRRSRRRSRVRSRSSSRSHSQALHRADASTGHANASPGNATPRTVNTHTTPCYNANCQTNATPSQGRQHKRRAESNLWTSGFALELQPTP